MSSANYASGVLAVRRRLGLAQPDFAQRVGISASYVSLIENGHRKPSIDVLESVARVGAMKLSTLIAICEQARETVAVGGPR